MRHHRRAFVNQAEGIDRKGAIEELIRPFGSPPRFLLYTEFDTHWVCGWENHRKHNVQIIGGYCLRR